MSTPPPSSDTTAGMQSSSTGIPSSTLQTQTSNPPNPTGISPTSLTSSAALYLYTFLATLVLLLVVSTVIISRNIILRRRHRRLIEEVIQPGTGPWTLTNTNRRRRRRNIGERPKVWETWIQQVDEKDNNNETVAWDDILPICAAYTDPPSSPQLPPQQCAENTVDPSPTASQILRFPRPFQRRPPSPQSSSTPPSLAAISSPKPASMLRVAVLVALPAPRSSRGDPSEERSPPVVEIGVIDVEVATTDKDLSS
ncbi:hypothetical protein V8B97DRAFT_1447940 [Scleroderma yunnanense]